MTEAAPVAAPLPLENPPDTSGRIELNLDPSQRVSTQIRATATGSREDLVGIEVEDNARRYVAIDAGVRSRVDDSPIEVKVGLPHFRRDKDGALSFKRPALKTNTEPTGLPKFVRRGKLKSIERSRKPLDRKPIKTPVVTVKVYDTQTGDLIDIQEKPREEFYNIIDRLGDGNPNNVKVSWNPRPEATAEHDNRAVHLTGRGSRGEPISAFDEITQQLEAAGITTWKGLAWQRGRLTQEVVEDTAVKQGAARGPGSIWTRTFVIKSTINGEIQSLERKNAAEFAEYLRKANADQGVNARPTTNMHLARGKTAAEVLNEREAAMYRYFGWLAVPQSPEEAGQAHRRLRQLEAHIKLQTDDTDSPESLLDEKDRAAMWLLDYPDVLDNNDDRFEKVMEVINSRAGRRRLKTLQEAVDRHGLVAVVDTAAQLRNAYLESMKKMVQPLSNSEQSISRFIEAMADVLPRYRDLLSNDERAKAVQTIMVDQLVGQSIAKIVKEDSGKAAYEMALIRLKRQIVPSGELNAQDQPAYKIREEAVFNEKFFTRYDPVAVTKAEFQIREQRQAFRKPAYDMARAMHEKIAHGIAPTQDEYAQFGRLLRRLIGE